MDKPDCFGKYKATFPTQGKTCRACSFAQECKVIEPKKGRPSKKLSEPDELGLEQE
jgi:lipoate synthase